MAVTFPTTLDSFTDRNSGDTISEDHMNDVQDAIELLEAKVGINTSAVDTSLDYKVNNFFVESTTKIFFSQATPPTGWTTDTSSKDNVLATKADSGTYSVVGADKGSFTYTGMTNGNVVAEAAHTHTGPSHFHQWYDYKSGATDATWQVTGGVTNIASNGTNLGIQAGADNTVNNDYYTSSTGTGATGAGSSHVHAGSTITHNGTDRPKATVGIIATYTGA